MDTEVMLILILMDVHCSQKTVFSFEKDAKSLLLKFLSSGKQISSQQNSADGDLSPTH